MHFIGVGGTLIGHLALLARQAGHRVSGSDQNIYPPMSDILAEHRIDVCSQSNLASLRPTPDLFILGNAGLARGHPAVEYLLRENLPFLSGAEWLKDFVLAGRWVMAIAGTHGKTTTASMLAWILENAGLKAGFVIGGVPRDFEASARLSPNCPFFVVEADEYDTSYFDRRAKFLHYHPRTLVIGNVEYDHADIYPNLDAIMQQFHLLLRTLPDNGRVIVPAGDDTIREILDRGLWTPAVWLGRHKTKGQGQHPLWRGETTATGFDLYLDDRPLGNVHWSLQGEHNTANALAAIAAADHAGVPAEAAIEALSSFAGVKRRLEEVGRWGALILYDDFAHHPTAIACTLESLRSRFPNDRIVALIEPSSHTMKRGDLLNRLADCTSSADLAIWQNQQDLQWSIDSLAEESSGRIEANTDLNQLVERVAGWTKEESTVHVVCMSNHAFGGIIDRITKRCEAITGRHAADFEAAR